MGAVDPALVGREFAGTPPFEVTRRRIADFASVVGATAAVHFDVDAARAAGFDDVVAPPTFAITIAFEAQAEYSHSDASGIDFSRVVHAEESFTYHRPIVAGDLLRPVMRVKDVVARGPLTMVTMATDLTDASGAPVTSTLTTLAVRGDA